MYFSNGGSRLKHLPRKATLSICWQNITNIFLLDFLLKYVLECRTVLQYWTELVHFGRLMVLPLEACCAGGYANLAWNLVTWECSSQGRSRPMSELHSLFDVSHFGTTCHAILLISLRNARVHVVASTRENYDLLCCSSE